jgi:hypothetical protein
MNFERIFENNVGSMNLFWVKTGFVLLDGVIRNKLISACFQLLL